MKDILKSISYVVIIVAVLFAGFVMMEQYKNQGEFGSVSTYNEITGGVTNSSSTVATTSATSVLSRNASRAWAELCNDDASNPAYLHFASATTSVAVKEGYKLGAGSCYQITKNNLYTGQIYGIASGGEVVITTVEK